MKTATSENTNTSRKPLPSFFNKDTNAFKNLYEETSTAAFSLILYIVKKKDLANQILEQTYLQIWDNISNYSSVHDKLVDYILLLAKKNAVNALA